MPRTHTDDLACPWCGRPALSWQDLMRHLDACAAYDAASRALSRGTITEPLARTPSLAGHAPPFLP